MQQGERRPIQRHVVQRQPGALRVVQLGMAQRERVGEATAQAGDEHLAGGELWHQALHQAAPGSDVEQHHRGHDHEHRQQHQHAQQPGQPARDPPHQNACPKPM